MRRRVRIDPRWCVSCFLIVANGWKIPAATLNSIITHSLLLFNGWLERKVEHVLFNDALNTFLFLSDKILTLALIDPDVPFEEFGNEELPFMHWLVVNICLGRIHNGQEVLSYIGPTPPAGNPHTYYFMIFEQNYELDPKEVAEYGKTNCSSVFRGRYTIICIIITIIITIITFISIIIIIVIINITNNVIIIITIIKLLIFLIPHPSLKSAWYFIISYAK